MDAAKFHNMTLSPNRTADRVPCAASRTKGLLGVTDRVEPGSGY